MFHLWQFQHALILGSCPKHARIEENDMLEVTSLNENGARGVMLVSLRNNEQLPKSTGAGCGC